MPLSGLCLCCQFKGFIPFANVQAYIVANIKIIGHDVAAVIVVGVQRIEYLLF